MRQIVLSSVIASVLAVPLLQAQQHQHPDGFQPDALHEWLMRDMSADLFRSPAMWDQNLAIEAQAMAFCGVPPQVPVEVEWGCKSIPLPNYLRSDALGLLPEQGLFITHVDQGSPAYTAGLRAGQLVVAIDGDACVANQPLPRLDQPRCVTVISDEGSIAIVVPSVARSSTGFGGLPQAFRELDFNFKHLPTSPIYSSSQRASSLAVSQVNRQTVICAVVNTTAGPVEVKLRGTPEEIACQLQELSPEVQQALRAQFGL